MLISSMSISGDAIESFSKKGIHETHLFDNKPAERYNIIKELVPDYRKLLIDSHQMNDEDFRETRGD